MERISSPPIELFYCYDPNTQDMELLRQLKMHLEDLRRSGSISEQEALAGDDEDVIKMRLERTHAILLLVSPDFLGSPSCNNQMEWAIERLNRKEAVRVIPVLLRPANTRNTAFSHLRKLPSNGRAVTLWDDRDDALQNVAEGIGQVVEVLQNQRRKAPEKQKEEGYVLNDPVSLPPTRIPKDKHKGWIAKHKRWIVLTASILLLVLLGAIFAPKLLPSTNAKIVGLSISVTPMGEQVGVSDGRFAFDTNRVDGPDKMQAAALWDTANAGKLWQKDVAQQIVQVASQDKTVVGVMGWPFSESSLNAVSVLTSAHIPTVSETASTDKLTNISPYFFRLVPPDFKQGAAKQVNDAHPLQGVSGRIAFGPDGNPLDKPLLLLSVDAQARFHEEALLSGCLSIDHCG